MVDEIPIDPAHFNLPADVLVILMQDVSQAQFLISCRNGGTTATVPSSHPVSKP